MVATDLLAGGPDLRAIQEAQRIAVGQGGTARYLATPFARFAPHSHTAYTVTVVLGGSVTTSVGGSLAVLGHGDAALTNPGQVHAAQALDFRLVSISLDPALVEEILTEMGLYQTGAQVAFATSTVTDAILSEIAERVAGEIQAQRPGWSTMIGALGRQLGVHLARSHLTVRRAAGVELSRAGPVDRRLRRAVEFMHDNYARDLALTDIARAAYLSESHFAHLFRDITGVTPYAYLANLRIERARDLLLSTDLPIGDVARRVGYRSQSHFARAFKAAAGASPRRYRESCVGPG